MDKMAINGHRSKGTFSAMHVCERHQNSFLNTFWDQYGAIKRTGPSRSGKFSLNRHSIGLRKVLSSRPELGSNVDSKYVQAKRTKDLFAINKRGWRCVLKWHKLEEPL